MKVAVTGGKGFLGTYVEQELLSQGFEPVILTRNTASIRKNERYTSYSRDSLRKCLIDCNSIVHLAAKRGSSEDVSEYLDNIKMTQNIYEVCKELEIHNIVFASTISVYSEEKLLPWKENQKTTPHNIYGVIKQACENLGEYYSNNTLLNIKNLRFAHLYGFNEKNDYMINRFMRQAFNHEAMKVNACYDSKREFLYAKDAARAIGLALKKDNKSGVFNIGSDDILNNYEVANIIRQTFKSKSHLEIVDINNIESSYMNKEKSNIELGIKNQYSFTQAMEDIYMLMNKRGEN